jgi:hypothetical protein
MKYLIILLVLFSSCVTQKRCDSRFPPIIKDSIIRETVTIYRDTTVYVQIKADTVHDTTTVYLDKGGLIQSDISFMNTRFATSKAYVLNSKLYHSLFQLEDSIAKTIANAIKNSSTNTVETVTIIEKVNELTGWQWFQVWAGRLLILTLFGLVCIFVFRMFF